MSAIPHHDPIAMVRAMYRILARVWGPQHWWPAETSFEVIAGAILTQNTAWTNVERALAKLRAARALSLDGVRALSQGKLEELIRSSGYYRQKARRLKDFVRFVDEKYHGDAQEMFAVATAQLRTDLLSLKGIGPETADAILLYAGSHEVFVVDTYARRILGRHQVVSSLAKYDDIRQLVELAIRSEYPLGLGAESTLSQRTAAHQPSTISTIQRTITSQVYNEMHGLIVQAGKLYCHKQQPNCQECPLRSLLPEAAQPIAK